MLRNALRRHYEQGFYAKQTQFWPQQGEGQVRCGKGVMAHSACKTQWKNKANSRPGREWARAGTVNCAKRTQFGGSRAARGADCAKRTQFGGLVQFYPPCGYSLGVECVAPIRGCQTGRIPWHRHPADDSWAGRGPPTRSYALGTPSPCHLGLREPQVLPPPRPSMRNKPISATARRRARGLRKRSYDRADLQRALEKQSQLGKESRV